VRRPEGKRPLGKTKYKWKDNITRIFKKLNGGMDWIGLSQDRERRRVFVNAVMNLCVP
jgi:hypothetical protein